LLVQELTMTHPRNKPMGVSQKVPSPIEGEGSSVHRRLHWLLRLCADAAALTVVQTSAWAQTWPTKTLRVVVPFTAGSATDITARLVAERLSAQLGQAIVVDNRPGAGGTIGVGVVARAEPDGYTILVHSSSFTVTPSTYPNQPYDTARDFSGITPLANLPNVLVIAPSRGLRSVKELVAAARAKPGTLTYASAGAGSATQLNAERFRLGAGFEAVHVPFKGTPEALTEILTGRVDYYFCPVLSVLQFIKDGKLLALAAGSTKRSSALPDVLTTLEAGIPNSDYNFWVGMIVPAKTSRDIVAKLHQQTLQALQAPDLKERMAKLGAEPMIMTPAQFDAYIRKEIASNAALVKAAAIKVN
jgi:tripartite-type tricarboxylate transporter receptor subunit TctC